MATIIKLCEICNQTITIVKVQYMSGGNTDEDQYEEGHLKECPDYRKLDRE